MKNTFYFIVILFLVGINNFAKSANEVKINHDGTNGLVIESDGTIKSEGTATVWDDLMVSPDVATKGGTPPVLTTYFGTMKLWAYQDAAADEVFFAIQIPHGWKEGTNMIPHVHWTTNTATAPDNSSNRVEWKLDYTIQKVGSVFTASLTTLSSNTITVPSTGWAQYGHNLTSLGTITGSGLEISSVLLCRLYRNAALANTNDTFAGDAFLLSFDIHYQKDMNGSRNEYTK